jgi:hypothetical protein
MRRAFWVIAALALAGCVGRRPPGVAGGEDTGGGDGAGVDGAGDTGGTDAAEDAAGGDTGSDAAADAATDAGGDAGSDAAADAATDAGGDAGSDTGGDAGTDAGGDAGSDTGGDAGTDAGVDAGADTGADTGTDAGADTGTDAGADTGTDAGADTGTGPAGTLLAPGDGLSWFTGAPNDARVVAGFNASGTGSLADASLASITTPGSPQSLGSGVPHTSVAWSADSNVLAHVRAADTSEWAMGELRVAVGSALPNTKGTAVPSGVYFFSPANNTIFYLQQFTTPANTGNWFSSPVGTGSGTQLVPTSLAFWRSASAGTTVYAIGDWDATNGGRIYRINTAPAAATVVRDPTRVVDLDVTDDGVWLAYLLPSGSLEVVPASSTTAPLTINAAAYCCVRFAGQHLTYIVQNTTTSKFEIWATSSPTGTSYKIADSTNTRPTPIANGNWVQFFDNVSTTSDAGDLHVTRSTAGGSDILVAQGTGWASRSEDGTRVAAVNSPSPTVTGVGDVYTLDLNDTSPAPSFAGSGAVGYGLTWASSAWLMFVSNATATAATGTLKAYNPDTNFTRDLGTGVPRIQFGPARAGVAALFIANADAQGIGAFTYRPIAAGNATTLAPVAKFGAEAGNYGIYAYPGPTGAGLYRVTLP